jgi:hypothetical protein
MEEKISNNKILADGLALLKDQLNDNFQIEPVIDSDSHKSESITIRSSSPQSYNYFYCEVFKGFQPRDLDTLYGRVGRRVHHEGSAQNLLVISNYLSPKSREILEENEFNYIDLSGNILIASKTSSLFIRICTNSKLTKTRFADSLKSNSALKLMRFLVDVRPPYGVVEIQKATSINRGYISRLLKVMYDEGLIEKKIRGPVTEVNWSAILKYSAEQIPLFKRPQLFKYISKIELNRLLESMKDLKLNEKLIISGSFAAYEIEPIAAPSILVMYSNENLETVCSELNLLQTDETPNVVILMPKNDFYLFNKRTVNDLNHAAISQVAIDCLSGVSRMPSEGEALVDWMIRHEANWRLSSVTEYKI